MLKEYAEAKEQDRAKIQAYLEENKHGVAAQQHESLMQTANDLCARIEDLKISFEETK